MDAPKKDPGSAYNPCKRIEDDYRKALEVEAEANKAAEPFVARSLEPGEENPVINSDGKSALAIEATKNRVKLQEALEKCRKEHGLA